MSEKLNRIKYRIWDGLGTVTSAINSWKPQKCGSEKEYENSLYNHLSETLKGLEITTQFSIGRSKADIVIEDKCIIELKSKLTKSSDYHRLIGQISDYKKWGDFIIILIVDHYDLKLIEDIKKHLVDLGLMDCYLLGDSDTAAVIVKDTDVI